MAHRSRDFVPSLSSDVLLPSAIALLEPDIAARLRPRLFASARPYGSLRRAMPYAIFYVDVDRSLGDERVRDAVPLLAVDRSLRFIEAVASRFTRLAINLPVEQFEHGNELTARLRRITSAVPEWTSVDLFVEVSTHHSVRVAETIAAGAAHRIPDDGCWNDIVVSFSSTCDSGSANLELRRPQYRRWARDLPRSVTPGESIDMPPNAFVYPLDDRWIVADASTGGTGRLLAELIAGNTSFSDHCCAGDRWISAASNGVDADNAIAWRRAALVHWLTTGVKATDEVTV